MKVLRFFMFNPLTRSYLKSDPWLFRWNKRLRCVMVEMWYTIAIFLPVLFPLMFMVVFFETQPGIDDTGYNLIAAVPFNVVMMALLNKDLFGGQSVVHRLLGYQVVTVKTNEPASKMQCMLRNILAPLWFLEMPFVLIYPKRRLGDFIADTKLIDVPPTDPELILNDIRTVKMDRALIMVLLLSAAYITALSIYFQ